MSIDIQCSGCGERLRVSDDSAGKNAKCPKCQAVFPVPAAGTSPSSLPGPEPRRAEPVATPAASPAAGTQTWQMKTPTGQTYGPVSRQELDSWVAEGRISEDCQVLAEGSDQWQWARDVFPALAAGAGVNVNPYSSPSSSSSSFDPSVSTGSRSHRTRPHRGGMILAFGILGLVVCGFFAPFAWAMGNTDLKEMRMGRMDRSGQGNTQAGMICGMIGSILLILSGLLFLVMCAGAGAGGL